MSANADIRKWASDKQEKEIAQFLRGRVQPASGGTAFGGGDVHTQSFLIEAKTCTYERNVMQIHHDWLVKLKKQAYEQRKPFSALAIRFDPDGEDFYVVDHRLMKKLVEHLEEEHGDG